MTPVPGAGPAPVHTPERRRTRPLAVAGLVAVALFWAGVLAAATGNPGYSHVTDYVSATASYGAARPGLGMATIAMLGLAHLAAALPVARGFGSAAAGAMLVLAGASGMVTAAVRIHCPGGAAGCARAGDPGGDVPLTDAVHGYSVRAYQVFLLLAMLALALRALRVRGGAASAAVPGWFGALAAVTAVVSTAVALRIGGDQTGAWQRAWLAVNTGWLALATLTSARSARRAPP